MTVRENLEMGAYVRSKRGAVAEAIDRCYELFPVLKKRRASQPASSRAVSSRWSRSAAR